MIVLVPSHATCSDVISIVSTVELSDLFLRMIFPVPMETFSEKVIIMFVSTRTSVELSAGESDSMVGGIPAVMKFHVVVSLIPANSFSAPSLKDHAAICT